MDKKTGNVIGSLISFSKHYNEIFKRMPNGCNVTFVDDSVRAERKSVNIYVNVPKTI